MPPNMDMDRLIQMDPKELVDLVKHYANENEALRRENAELFNSRDLLQRDHEIVCRENERLLKKLEDVNSACIRSPIIPARGQYIDQMETFVLNSNPTEIQNVQTKRNSLEKEKRDSSAKNQQIEIDKKGIGKTLSNFVGSLKTRGKSSSDNKIPPNPRTATPRLNDGLNSAASTLASIISRQAFNIPWKSNDIYDNGIRDWDENDRNAVDAVVDNNVRSSLPNIVNNDRSHGHDDNAGSGVRPWRDNLGSGAIERSDSLGSGLRFRRDSLGSGLRMRRSSRDSLDSGLRMQRDESGSIRDPFGSPVTPHMYNNFRHQVDNARAAAAMKATTTSG